MTDKITSFKILAEELLKRANLSGNEHLAKELIGDAEKLSVTIKQKINNPFQEIKKDI
jgi:hypothetical protein